jgi:hypothetical protein
MTGLCVYIEVETELLNEIWLYSEGGCQNYVFVVGFYGCGLVDGCLRVSESHVALSQAGHVSMKWRCMLEHFAVSRLHSDV